jgi:hypothetical protein
VGWRRDRRRLTRWRRQLDTEPLARFWLGFLAPTGLKTVTAVVWVRVGRSGTLAKWGVSPWLVKSKELRKWGRLETGRFDAEVDT